MVYKRLYFQVIVRVLMLLVTCMVLGSLFFSPSYLHASVVLSLLLVVQTTDLIRYLNRTNHKLAQFFSSLQDRGTSLSYEASETGDSFRELGQRLGEINRMFREERREKEAQHNYLNYLVDQIGVGIVTFREDGSVDLLNPAAGKLLGEKRINDLAGLNRFNPEFEKLIHEMQVNEKSLIRIIVRNELIYLSVQKSLFKLEGKFYGLISFQDINSELDKKELDSWQKIIRVLTHEIMSSISPVTSLSGHLLDKVKAYPALEPGTKGEERLMEDLTEGLEIINSRGAGLMEFVRHYHSLTHLPIPVPEEVQLEPFLQRIVNLVEPECKGNDVKIELEVGDGLQLSMDPHLVEQVLLNLFRNSIQALEGVKSGKRISVVAGRTVSGIQITVSDNGCGIDVNNMDNIFIPFYTTREKGSGIGLSMAKQIMRLHNGQISVRSEPGEGAAFLLKF